MTHTMMTGSFQLPRGAGASGVTGASTARRKRFFGAFCGSSRSARRARRQRRKIRRGRGVFGLASRALRGAGIFLPFRRSLALAALLAAERLRRGLRLAGHGFAGFPVGGIIALADDLRIGRIFIVFGIPRSLRLFVREGGVILVVTDDGYRLSLFAAFACVSSYTARTPSAAGPSVPLPQTPRGSTGLR